MGKRTSQPPKRCRRGQGGPVIVINHTTIHAPCSVTVTDSAVGPAYLHDLPSPGVMEAIARLLNQHRAEQEAAGIVPGSIAEGMG